MARDVTDLKRTQEGHSVDCGGRSSLLWHARNSGEKTAEKLLKWPIKMTTKEGRINVLPVGANSRQSYFSAWHRNRVDEDCEQSDSVWHPGNPGKWSYSQEFRCRRLDGDIRWLSKECKVTPIGPERGMPRCLHRYHRAKTRGRRIAGNAEGARSSVVGTSRKPRVRSMWQVTMAAGKTRRKKFFPVDREPGEPYC